MKKIYRISPLIFQLSLLLLLPIDWYKDLRVDVITFTREDVNGLYVFMFERWRIGIIYLLSIFIQIALIQNKKWIFSIVSNIVLILLLLLFPVAEGTFKYFTTSTLVHFYDVGLYLSVFFLLISMGLMLRLAQNHK